MSDGEAVAKVVPQTRNDVRRLWIILGYLSLTVAIVAAILFARHRRQEEMERTWQSATATIEDVRSIPAVQIESGRGGAMLYRVEILTRYNTDGAEQRRWIKVEQLPKSVSDIRFEEFRWKGKQCTVRWKSSQPDQVVAEVN